MGGKSFKRAWSPEELEKTIRKIKKEEEKKRGGNIVDILKGGKKDE